MSPVCCPRPTQSFLDHKRIDPPLLEAFRAITEEFAGELSDTQILRAASVTLRLLADPTHPVHAALRLAEAAR